MQPGAYGMVIDTNTKHFLNNGLFSVQNKEVPFFQILAFKKNMLITNNLVCIAINQMIRHVFMCAGYAGMYACMHGWMDGWMHICQRQAFILRHKNSNSLHGSSRLQHWNDLSGNCQHTIGASDCLATP